MTACEMRAYAAAGHFKAVYMGPKVEACLRSSTPAAKR